MAKAEKKSGPKPGAADKPGTADKARVNTLFIYVYMYVRIYIYIYTCVYICIYIYIHILPCATSVCPNAFSRQQAKPKVIIQDVAE